MGLEHGADRSLALAGACSPSCSREAGSLPLTRHPRPAHPSRGCDVIDVLLPFYGDPELMRLAVRSVLDQDTRGWRLVIVDDCYPDDETSNSWPRPGPCVPTSATRGPSGSTATSAGHSRWPPPNTSSSWAVTTCWNPATSLPCKAHLTEHPGCGHRVPRGSRSSTTRGSPWEPLVDRVKRVLRPRADGPSRSSPARTRSSRLMAGNWTYFPSLCWRRDLITDIDFRPGYGVVLDLGLLVDVLVAGGGAGSDPGPPLPVPPACGERVRDEDASSARGSRRSGATSGRSPPSSSRNGLRRAARAARGHVASRLHAAALLPVAARNRDRAAVARLLRHATR